MGFGAEIESSGGSEGTHVVCDDLGNKCHYHLAEVNSYGKVVTDTNHRFLRLYLEDLGQNGVQILRGVNDNPERKPGESINVVVGSHQLAIKGTSEKGVTLNGEKPNEYSRKLDETRYV